jgi:putative endonuclease
VKDYYVYILANQSGTLYTGITNDLEARVYQHKSKQIPGFTQKYNITRLVYFESSDDVTAAIAREKQIKGMLRSKKLALIKTLNPELIDLSQSWFDDKDFNNPGPP